MKTNRSKKIFLVCSVIVPFLAYCMYYYGMMVKNAPYRFSDFKSIVFKYGKGKSFENLYDSRTGFYQYKTRNSQLVKKTLHISKDELLFLHRKASDLGFWNFPINEQGSDSTLSSVSPHYFIQLNYVKKSKTVLFDAAFDGDPALKDANERLIKEIQKVLDEAETNQQK